MHSACDALRQPRWAAPSVAMPILSDTRAYARHSTLLLRLGCLRFFAPFLLHPLVLQKRSSTKNETDKILSHIPYDSRAVRVRFVFLAV